MVHEHVFITGCTNSGSGFLRFLISKHPELSVLMEEGHKYSNILPNDNSKSNMKNRLFSLHQDVYRWTGDKKIDRKQLKKDLYKHWNLNKKYLVEKSGHHMLRVGVINEVFAPAKFIWLVRNGYVVCEGLRRRKGHDIKDCAKHWNRANKIMMEDSKGLDVHIVKYEDLCANPQETLDKIFAFIGVEKIKISGDIVIPRQNMCGTKKHFKLGDSPDFNKKSFVNLSKSDMAEITSKISGVMRELGYDVK